VEFFPASRLPGFSAHLRAAGVGVGYILLQVPGLRDKTYDLLVHWDHAQFGGLYIYFSAVADFLAMFSLALIVLIRSNRTARQQALLESEMANAREVQQVILPEAMGTIPGFHIESVYEPAREVGGDFFQVLPAPGNGLILVIGDVAGKGLPAAMLVSVLVGAARTAAQYDPSPAAILGQLNAHLMGRTNGGFCTALAAHITAEGVVSIANAGHLPPYLDGKEMELPGALPLGIVSGISYDSTRIDLGPGSRLTFYSDGVVEAQDKRGQLFGFERAREFSTQPAEVIAEAAKAFGQQDDITVITVELMAAEKSREVGLTSAVWAPA
jgi:serine phosphatase RsbU (regulator of sigma subunit)